jgi:hypothetical protein
MFLHTFRNEKKYIPLHHNVIENGTEDATDDLSGKRAFW